MYPGGTQNLFVALSSTNGFSGDVSVSISGLPSGVTASPATFSLTGFQSQHVQFTAVSTAAAGSSTVTISGSSQSLSHTVQLALTVTGPPGITLALQPTTLVLIPGVQQSMQIAVQGVNGFNQLVSGTLSGLPAGVTVNSTTFSVFPGGTATLYFTAATGASSGTVQINASSGTLTASAQLPISINTTPDFALTTGTNNAFAVSQSASTFFSLSATPFNGFNQPISISFSAVPAGVTFSPASFTLQPGGPSQKVTIATSFSAAPTNGANLQAVGTSGGITHQLQLSLIISPASISVGIQPSGLTVAVGSTNSFELQVSNHALGTPIGNIAITVGGAPAGVTVSPASYTAPPQGVGFNVFVEAAASGATNGSITVTAALGPIHSTASIPVAIGPPNNYPPVPLTTPDQLVHADTLTPYYSFPPPNFTVYHAATQRFFSTEPYLGRLYVVDAASRQLTATLNIPGAFGLDQTPDGSVLYVGTMIGDLYVVDPVHLTILRRYPSSTISPWGFTANAVYALADGKLILERYFLVPGYSWVDGNGPIALWDPQSNDITVFYEANSGNGGEVPQSPSCLSGFENVILTNNRTRVLLAPVPTSEGSSAVCSLDPEADTWSWSPRIAGGDFSALTTFAVSPDGNTLVSFDGYNIYNLDPATLTVKNTIPVPVHLTGFIPGSVLLLSQDNTSVFITDSSGADVFDEYNLTTGKMTGWISQLNVLALNSITPVQPFYQAMSPAGLAAGVIPGAGIGLLDTTAVHAPPIGARFSQTALNIPYGPVGGGTGTSWLPNVVGVQPPPLGSIYFGASAATDINANGFPGYLEAVTPPGNPGPVDVRSLSTDGASQLIPDGFSYGPWVEESLPTYSTEEGGGLGDLFGYGFGLPLYTGGALFIDAPPDLQVTVGGAGATLTGFSPDPYIFNDVTAAVFPSQAIHYTIPSGIPGATSAITVSNTSGTTTATQPMSYLPAVQQYPVSGQLVDGIYDPARDVYYFSDVAQIKVFSLTQNTWLASIPVPAPQGAYGPERLWGMSLSPDGSRLVVADAGSLAIDVIDLNQPSSIQSYPLAARVFGDPITEVPTVAAITSSGIIYIAASDLNGDGGCGFMLKLDPSASGYLPNVGPAGINCLPTQGGMIGPTLATSSDGSRIYYDDAGEVGWVDTASGVVSIAPISYTDLGLDDYEIDLGANQTRLYGDGFLTDSNLNGIGLQSINYAESIDASYLYGGALSGLTALCSSSPERRPSMSSTA